MRCKLGKTIISIRTVYHYAPPKLQLPSNIYDSIIDNEIFLSQHYKIFRCDRTVDTHPPDPSNPKKFRKNGGGVLIAAKAVIAYEVKRVNVECKAELLAIEIITENKSKVIIATCYRVGTLGQDNCFEITNTICKLLRKKNLKKFFMIGDFNLPGIQWENGTNFNDKVTDPIKTSFVNSFAENGLEQCINEPTHRAGNVLDLLLTTSSKSISNLKINDTPLCKSDHFSINFEVDLKVKPRKSIKRKCFNFKKANWDNLNNELAKINWFNLLDSIDPNDSWNTFVNLLHHYLNKNIPTITTKGEFNPPWFDSECHSKCREKERLHKKFVSTKNIPDGIKYSNCRREFKTLIRTKKRDNLYSSTEDNYLISIKFRGYVKSTSNTHRIPEVMCLHTTVSSDAETKVTLFNQYFFQQFSEASNYEIDINFSNDSDFDINYSPERIEKLLKDVNINKAVGPDGIPGIVIKRCSGVLAEPLSIIFPQR